MVLFDTHTHTQDVDAKLQKPVDPKLLVATNAKGPAARRSRPSKKDQPSVSAKVPRLITPIRCFDLTPLLSTTLLPQRSLSQPLELEVVGGKRARRTRTRSSTQPDQDEGADST